MMRVHLIDSQALIRSRLRERLAVVPGVVIAGESSDGADGLQRAILEQPEIVLIDPYLGSGNGLQIVRALLANCRDSTIIVLSSFLPPPYLARLNQLGVHRCYDKTNEFDKAISDIRELASAASPRSTEAG